VADLIVTSPPYADARKKHYDSILPEEFAEWFTIFHRSFYDVLKPDGTRHRYVWKTIEKLQDLGWYAIDDYIWYKTNPMPGYWPTRLRDGWEYCFHLAKSKKTIHKSKYCKNSNGGLGYPKTGKT
jgi:site-specific DNA-methyltransferase (adenine-specific)